MASSEQEGTQTRSRDETPAGAERAFSYLVALEHTLLYLYLYHRQSEYQATRQPQFNIAAFTGFTLLIITLGTLLQLPQPYVAVIAGIPAQAAAATLYHATQPENNP